MATFVRKHVEGSAGAFSGSASTVAGNTTASVAPGNTLLAVISGAASRTVSSLTKPGGETASWVKVSAVPAGAGTVFAEVWAIKTTVTWSSGFTITATLSGACDGRAITIAEWMGLSTTVVHADSVRASSASQVTAEADGVVPGDVVVQVGVVNTGGSSQFRATSTGSSGTATGTSVAFDGQRPSGFQLEAIPAMLSITGAGDVSYTPRAVSFNGVGYDPVNRNITAVVVGLESDDYPPDVPTLTSMVGGASINRGATNRASHTFSSANFGDSQSKFDLRYRITGAPSWTTILAAGTTALYYDFAPGSLAAGDYERQVKVYGALGKDSGWSPSGFFTAADAPDGPTFIYPIDGQSVDQFETVTWSTPDGQESYQLRRLLDVAGSPGAVIAGTDTGEVVDAITRSLPLNFSVNNRAEHIEIRVKVDGLWSEWDDVLVDVSYSPPPTPSRTLYADIATATILVVIDNPAPTGDDPAAVYNDIYVDDGKGEQRRATSVSTNGSWRYMTPVSSRDYELSIRVVAVAANGTTSSE